MAATGAALKFFARGCGIMGPGSNAGNRMQCTACRTANPQQARFCMQCGQPLVSGGEAPAATAGAAGHAQRSGENRIVTVLFVDIATSTKLANALGPEPWHHLLSEFFALLSGTIERWGGSVNLYTGDGLMSLFGAPVALEEHALAACRAALQAQQRLGPLADRVRLEHGLNFGVRMGLHSGPVVVGAIADDWRRDYTAQGATVHLAARMEQMAQPGSVYLTDATARLVRGYLRLRELGPTRIKGLEAPVQVAELQAGGETRERLMRRGAEGLSPFVGREGVLARLEQARERILHPGGRGGAIVLSGEAGLGKSRLCHELITRWSAQARAAGGHLDLMRCLALSQGQGQPLEPVRRMFLDWLGVPAEARPEQARRTVAGAVMLDHPHLRENLPALFDLLDIAEPGQDLLPADARLRRQRLLAASMCQGCERPTLIWVDDWHWMDEASAALLADWLPEFLDRLPVLLLVTTRPVELPEWLQRLAGRPLRLEPLGDAEMRALLAELIGDWVGAHPLGERLVAYAEGNPYFAEEAVSYLVDEGLLEGPRGGRSLREEAPELRLPASVQALLAARLDSLGAADRGVLELAALIGREFSADWLASALEQSTAALRETLYRLADAGFVRAPEDGGDWAFAHGLLQEEAVQRQLDSVRRRRQQTLQQRLAARIESGSASPLLWAQVAALAEAAGAALEAAHAYHAAGLEHGRRDMAEAMRLYRRGLAQAVAAPPEAAADILQFRLRTALLRGGVFGRAKDSEIAQWEADGQAFLLRRPNPELQVELWMSTGVYALNHGNARTAHLQIRRAFLTAAEQGAMELLARFRVPVLFSHFARGALCAGLDVLDQHTGTGWREGPLHRDNYLSRAFRGLLLGSTGRLQEAIELLQAVVDFAAAQGTPVSWISGNLVEMRVYAGQREGLRPLAEDAVRAARDFGSPAFDEVANRAMALALHVEGDTRAGLALLQHWTPQVAPGAPGEIFCGPHYEMLAQLARDLGELEQARAWADHAVAVTTARGQLYWQARARLERLRLPLPPALAARDQRRVERLLKATGAGLLEPAVARLRAAPAA